jgi:type II secretion system protein H
VSDLKKAGFTLVELMIVVILISVFTALVVPRFKRTAADFELKNAAFNLYKIVQFSRERSLAEGRPFKIHFKFKAREYQLLGGPDFKPVEGRSGKKIRLSEGLLLEGREEDLSCYPDGNCDPASVRIRNEDNAYEVSVENLGGVIRIREIS